MNAHQMTGPELQLSEEYKITQEVGPCRASFAAYGVDRATGQEVFMKAREDRGDGHARLRTYYEAEHYASLNHSRIPTLVKADPFAEYPYVVTERMPDAGRYVISSLSKRPNHELVSRLILSVAEVIQYVHDQEIVHRDIKETNMGLRWMGTAALYDFELAMGPRQREIRSEMTPAEETGPIRAHITKENCYVGTATHISPEQLLGEEATYRSDQYAMSVTMYRLLYGELPFTGTTDREIIEKKAVQEVMFWAPGREVPRALRLIVERGMQINPADRYDSVAELAEDVQRYLHDQNTTTGTVAARPRTSLRSGEGEAELIAA